MDESSLSLLGALVVLVGLSAVFSGLEVALLSVPQVRVKALVKNRKPGAKALRRIKAQSSRMIITILVGNNIVNTSVAAIATALALQAFGSAGLGVATGAITLVILVFGEITPKTLASRHADRISLAAARPLEILMKVLWPVVFCLEKIPNMLGKRMKKKSAAISKLEIRAMIEYGAEKNVLEAEEKKIMLRTTRLKNTDAEDIMTPMSQIFALESEAKLVDSVRSISSHGYSRVPVYKGDKRNIIGILYVKAILTKLTDTKTAQKPVKTFVQKPIFLDKDSQVKDIFKLFLNEHTHIAIVTDGKKNVGLVTLEDMLEEIVGEIVDEHDITPFNVLKVGKNSIVAHVDTTISHVNKSIKGSIPISKSRETIGELFLKKSKRKKHVVGEKLDIGHCKLCVMAMEQGKVMRLKVIKK